MLTKHKFCGIIKMPNKNLTVEITTFFTRDNSVLFWSQLLISVKARFRYKSVVTKKVALFVFVWRQSELTFFGALTSVGALLLFGRF